MADKHPVDPLAELDTLLRAELAAEPSHEFLPRVRERIRHEPEPSHWWRPKIIVPIAAVAAVVLAVNVTLWPRRPATNPDPATGAPRAVVARVPSTERGVPNAGPRVPSTETRVPNTEARKPKTEYREPSTEVMVDGRQREALLSFVRLANSGALTDEAFMLTTAPPGAIEDQVKTIAVEPVAVSPIPAGGVLLPELDWK